MIVANEHETFASSLKRKKKDSQQQFRVVATILKKSFRVVVTHRKSKVTLFARSKIVWKEKKYIYVNLSI